MKKLLWFDDRIDERKGIIQELAEKLGIELLVARAGDPDRSWPDAVMRIAENDVALILVDHCLADTRDATQSIFGVGSSLCTAIRTKWKCVPVVGISAAGKEDIRREDREEYTDFIPLGDVRNSSCADRIKVIAEGFSLLRGCGSALVSDKIEQLLRGLEIDKTFLQRVVPRAVMDGRIVDNGHALYKWFRDVLFRYQGLLVDKEMIAASIGVTDFFFKNRIAPKLMDCEYKGLFSGLDGERYWRDAVFVCLAEMVKDDGSLPVSRYVDKLKESDADMAHCHYCNEPYTEVIASEEQTEGCQRRHPMHFRCVEPANLPHPNYFDPIYVPLGGAN